MPKTKKILIYGGCVFLILLAIGSGVLVWKLKGKKQPVAQAHVEKAEEQKNKENNPTTKRAGIYETYDVKKLNLAADGKVVLFFNATWSKTSKELDKELKNSVSKMPSNFTILTVDYNKSADLKKKYEVPFENTFVQVDANGVMVNRWSGSENLDEIVALTK